MGTSYDPLLPTGRDWVRFLAGDRGPTRFVLKDEEIDALLTEEGGNKYLAAARAGDTILAQGRDVVSKVVDGLALTWGQSAESSYRAHLKRLRVEGAGQTMTARSKSRTFRVLTRRS